MRKEFLAFEGGKNYLVRGGSKQLLDKKFWDYQHTNCSLSLGLLTIVGEGCAGKDAYPQMETNWGRKQFDE